ncbi:tyrosine-type recombinase/integrase [Streptomyces monticola]|uniref:Tyrosine-type recombinase/integrase n=1 Tax=Streptomyces monticola TaxID=2666263 RepID=A0ABW2JKN9_9ACTN
MIKRPRIHDIRHSHASWLVAAKVPLPAIQGWLGHESVTTTVDRYGHLLDALDDEVIAAVEWAMNPSAPLPGFLLHSGLADAAEGHPSVPHQQSGDSERSWTDASDIPRLGAGPVYVVTLGGREVPFADRQHAQDVADQWTDDHVDEIEAGRESRVRRGPCERPYGVLAESLPRLRGVRSLTDAWMGFALT